ncbi:unnamed protein product [Candida verbasci]|uniref:Small ribosomal subunit protein bS18m n=1 Tax=Candida verbasci TaxID=1227364 RepID=A0A9W4TUT4_9ASCO|nr:unnamed protein product [Candida verbasci]
MLPSKIRLINRSSLRSFGTKSYIKQQSQESQQPIDLKIEEESSTNKFKSKTSWQETFASETLETTEDDLNDSFSKITEELKPENPPVHISSQFTKRFYMGNTYNPFDFSLTKIKMDKMLYQKDVVNKKVDIFEETGINPKDLYFMPEILSKFLTSTGQILPREETGLNEKNHRLLGTAIQSARSLGILSTVHRYSTHLPTRNI